MDINQFKNHLQHVDGILHRTTKPTATKRVTTSTPITHINEDVWSGTDSDDPGVGSTVKNESTTIEAEVSSYLDSYFGDSLNEDATDEEIMEAITDINDMRTIVNEYLETEDENLEGAVNEYFDNYFGDSLTEDVSEDDLLEAISNLNNLCDMVNEYFDIEME
tara:strand:+ start:526 stop:1014 length:489 start_codon:yes stop_codon:yes gene_type:complete